jgi:membrane protease subunit HflK
MSDAANIAKNVIQKIPAGIGGVVLLILVVVGVMTSWFTVDPEEEAVVLRFGKINGEVRGMGFQTKLPFGIDQEYKVPVLRQLKEEFGFRTVSSNSRSQYQYGGNHDAESLMLTGDLNVADVEWVTQFTIVDPKMYLFKYRVHDRRPQHNEAIMAFRDMNEAVMRQVVGDHTITEVLTSGRTLIQTKVIEKLQAMCKEYELGVRVDQVILQDINPPERVKPYFNKVNQAEQERDTLIERARAQYNQVIEPLEGEAEKSVATAKGFKERRINEAKGDASAFNSLFTEYMRAPEITRKRIYLETMKTVLNQAGRKIILDEDVSGILPLLNLNQEGTR